MSKETQPVLTPDEEDALAAQYDLSFPKPLPVEPTEAEMECDRLLRALKDVRDEQAANRRLYDEQVRSAARWLERVNETPQRKEAWLLIMLRAVAEFVPRYGGKKSRELPHGVIGWRASTERLEVEDEAAALAWSKVNGLPFKEVEAAYVSEIAKKWKEMRRVDKSFVPPGCRVVEAEERFYANALDVS